MDWDTTPYTKSRVEDLLPLFFSFGQLLKKISSNFATQLFKPYHDRVKQKLLFKHLSRMTKVNSPNSNQSQQVQHLAEVVEVHENKVFCVKDDHTNQFHPLTKAVKIRNILSIVLAEKLAEQLDFRSGVKATRNLKYKTGNEGWD